MVVFASLFLLLSIAGTSFATVDASSVEIQEIGIVPGGGGSESLGIKIRLINRTGGTLGTDWEADKGRYFYLATTVGNVGMASILTAFSMEKNIWVRLGGNAESNSLILMLFVKAAN